MSIYTVSDRYHRAMIAGQIDICIRIEQDHDLFGYPPEIVSTGLIAFDQGKNVQDAVAEYLNGATP